MKKIITKISCLIASAFSVSLMAQSPVAITFDTPTFSLTPNSFYSNTAVNDWHYGVTKFRYAWNSSFGGYWESGTAYTNIKDTTNGSYTNIYGCAAYSAYNGNNYATSQDGAIVTFSNTTTVVSGFFITNTTFAYKTIKNGNAFSRKFGDTTGTNCAGLYPQGGYPDYFKLIVYGFKGGIQKTDSVQFYLADYRFNTSSSDYVVKNWQYVNCTSIGVVDSLVFKLRSSDNGSFGMNTPAFFSIDNFTTINTVGINELENVSNSYVFPNPTNQNVTISYDSKTEDKLVLIVLDVTGKILLAQQVSSMVGNNTIEINLETIEAGVYVIELSDANSSKRIKLIKL